MKMNFKFNLAGKIITLLCIIAAAAFSFFLCTNSIVPPAAKIVVPIVLAVIFALIMWSQFSRRALRFFTLAFGILLCALLIFCTYYLVRMQDTLDSVTTDVVYKTDNMIAVTLKDSELESIEEAGGVSFGIQTAADRDNTDKMLENIEKQLGADITVTEYSDIISLCNALLDGEIEVIVYNEAFTDIIYDQIPDYLEKIKILYQYGIKVEVDVHENQSGEVFPGAVSDIVNEPFCVYVSGIDVEGSIQRTSRSDVNIIMAVNPKTKKILLVTTPRDYYVPFPGVTGEMRDKLTHAGIYGVNTSMNTLSQLYETPIEYYLRVNFTSLTTVVDILGGIEVYSEHEFTTTYGKYKIVKGMNHLDGYAALCFCRDRFSFADGDHQRGKNQQAVLTGILNKAMSPAILKNADELLTVASGCMETNMTAEKIGALVNMQLSDMAKWDIQSVAATGSGGYNTCYSMGSMSVYVMWPSEESVREITQKMHEVLEIEE